MYVNQIFQKIPLHTHTHTSFGLISLGSYHLLLNKPLHKTMSSIVKTFESPFDCKEIKPVNPKGNQSWIFIGRTDAEAEAPILWPSYGKSWLIGKDPDAGKDWSQEEKGMTEDEMVWWHHWLNGHEFEQALGVGDGQGSLACCSSWDCKELTTTEQLNWTGWSLGKPRHWNYYSRC